MIRFDSRITIERRSGAKDADGNVRQSWDAVASLWANVRETPGREVLEAGRVSGKHSATVWLRSGPTARSVTPADRVIFRGVAWDVLGAHPSGQERRVVELLIETDGRPP